MPTISTADGRHSITYSQSGRQSAARVVLIHAIGLDASYWQPQIDRLAQDYHVIAYDILGHGKSSPLASNIGFRALVGDLDRVIEATGSGTVHLVGLSLGGMIAQHAAVWRPQCVRSLTLIDTAATLPEAARDVIRDRAQSCRNSGMAGILNQTIARWFTPEFTASHPEVIARVSRTLLDDDAETHARFWEVIATLDIAPRLPEIACPVLVVVGEKDPTTPVAAAQLIANAIPDSRLEVLSGLSHMVPLEAPQKTAELIAAFLAQADRRPVYLPDASPARA